MGGSLKAKDISTYFSKGRHFNIQIIVMGHGAIDIDKKSRENIKTLYVTTQNTKNFFKDIKEKFDITMAIEKYSYVKYGVIEYDLIMNEYIVYDENHKIHINSKEMEVSTLPDFNVRKFANVKKFSVSDTQQIITFLETRAIGDLNITEETFLYYLAYYLIQIEKISLKMSKYEELIPQNYHLSFQNLSKSMARGIRNLSVKKKELNY